MIYRVIAYGYFDGKIEIVCDTWFHKTDDVAGCMDTLERAKKNGASDGIAIKHLDRKEAIVVAELYGGNVLEFKHD